MTGKPLPPLSAVLAGRCCLFLSLVLLLPACTTPSQHLQTQATQSGFNHIQLNVDGFTLSGFYQFISPGGGLLHVYLEGDGKPWEQGLLPASDPTTRESVMLPLMAQDQSASLYLARPCYNGHAQDPGCSKTLWTGGRYSETVISSMASAIKNFCHQNGYNQLILIGHSGGGSLAILLAAHLPQTRALLTLAANYDIDAWADYHGYSRLHGSINPASQPNTGIPEWHYLAEQDSNIPVALFFQSLSQRPNSQVAIIPGMDHNHGWQTHWPGILSKLAEIR